MGKDVKWSLLGLFVCFSLPIGLLIDIFILFPSSADSRGHSIPVFTILLPLFAIFVTVVAAVTELIALSVKALKGESSGSKNYEYLKISQKCNGVQAPALILHEIDRAAGRCSVRCIYIYQDGHAEKFMNNGIYAPVPTAQSIHTADVSHCQTAYIMTRREFENVWNSAH